MTEHSHDHAEAKATTGENPALYPAMKLDLKNAVVVVDGKTYRVEELLQRVVRDLKGSEG